MFQEAVQAFIQYTDAVLLMLGTGQEKKERCPRVEKARNGTEEQRELSGDPQVWHLGSKAQKSNTVHTFSDCFLKQRNFQTLTDTKASISDKGKVLALNSTLIQKLSLTKVPTKPRSCTHTEQTDSAAYTRNLTEEATCPFLGKYYLILMWCQWQRTHLPIQGNSLVAQSVKSLPAMWET